MMYPRSTVNRVQLEGNVADYGFSLISKIPTYNDLAKWGISMPKGNDYTLEELYAHALKCVKGSWTFFVEQGYKGGDLLSSGYFTEDIVTPERVAKVWMSVSMYESGDRDNDYFPRQFFTDVDVEYKGVKKHHDRIPLFARNIVNGNSVPNLMSAGCLAYGMGNISAYAGVILDKEMAYRGAWDWKYNVELSIKMFSRKWYIAQSHNRGLPLDAAVIYYHGWDGKSNETIEQYLNREDLDDKGSEKRSSKRYYDNVMKLYKEYFMSKTIGEELGLIGMRGGHAVNDNPIPSAYADDYAPYKEGAFVHDLTKKLSDEFGFYNAEPETSKLSFEELARRAVDYGCNTYLENHTNWSVNSNNEPNRDCVLIIYDYRDEAYQPMYLKMAQIIAKHMGVSRAITRIRMSETYPYMNWYGAIRESYQVGIKHNLIVEYSYHVDVAGREVERTEQIKAAWREILATSVNGLNSFADIQKGCKDDVLVRKVQTRLKDLGFGKYLGTYGEKKDGVDGDFGDATEEAVKAYKTSKGLEINGIIDKETYYLMFPEEVIVIDEVEDPVEEDDDVVISEPVEDEPVAVDYDWLKGKLSDVRAILDEIDSAFSFN